ncbi:MAG TPA: SAM-dependent methyltransferase [Rhizomicrobium sp.]|jgi:NADH dehydrogenase [ubiquinone] 1 alpha subcomplex assembly factor 7|nr:SAM-dependent methyltransferase [Rhizomicrobium sp.]
MTPAGQRIAETIASQGPISIAQFMTQALLDPACGYYATRAPIGAGGDFITAPEISQMFGELAGLWLAQAWHDQGRPARPLLVELGPGRGTLMADALRATKLMPAFRAGLEVLLVEASPVLRQLQQETLKDCGVPVRWAESFAAPERPLFLLANEFFDALPIRQYVKSARGWCERMVTRDGDGALAFALSPVPIPAHNLPPNRDGAPPGGVYETSPAGEALAQEIGHAVAAWGGAALIVDYGYETPGFGETLQAVEGHRFADVLTAPGASDLSAHVDFRALGDAALRGGAAVCGPVGQGAFLLALGLAERAWRLAQRLHGGADLVLQEELRIAVERLTAPEQMGTLFKALALVPKTAPTPPGF